MGMWVFNVRKCLLFLPFFLPFFFKPSCRVDYSGMDKEDVCVSRLLSWDGRDCSVCILVLILGLGLVLFLLFGQRGWVGDFGVGNLDIELLAMLEIGWREVEVRVTNIHISSSPQRHNPWCTPRTVLTPLLHFPIPILKILLNFPQPPFHRRKPQILPYIPRH